MRFIETNRIAVASNGLPTKYRVIINPAHIIYAEQSFSSDKHCWIYLTGWADMQVIEMSVDELTSIFSTEGF